MRKIFFTLFFIVFFFLVSFLSYVFYKKGKAPSPTPPQPTLSAVLNLYIWEDYINPEVIEEFEKKFGVKVKIQTFESEDEMLSTIQSSPSAYDLVVVSDTLVKEMSEMKLLSPINLEDIPNFKYIAKEFQNPPYDPQNKYSVPYMWGTTGIIINKKYIKETEPTLAILWNPEYKGKIAMLNDMREVIGVALKYLGFSGNSTDLSELQKARELLLQQKPLLRGYEDVMTIREDLISEKLWAAQIYSGDGKFAESQNPNLKYLIPKEGGFLWVDNFVIPIGSPNKYTAEIFINFLLDPEISAKNANYLRYANTNEEAAKFTDPEILQDPYLYPSKELREKLEFIHYIEDPEVFSMYNRIWAELLR